MRVAIYYTPDEAHPLARAAAAWLGRSAFPSQPGNYRERDKMVAPELSAGPDHLVAEPRRYGFHATLKAPFRLAENRSLDELADALAEFSITLIPPSLGPLRIADLGNFTALVPSAARPETEALAADIVRAFEPFRAPLTDTELARRLASELTARQEHNLRRFGYPHVLEDFRFHMTLTGRLSADRRPAVIGMLHERFNAVLDSVPLLDRVALFVEAEPGADFQVHQIIRLSG